MATSTAFCRRSRRVSGWPPTRTFPTRAVTSPCITGTSCPATLANEALSPERALLREEQAREWLASYQDIPDESRHLAMHYGHLVHVNAHDRAFVTGELLSGFGLTLTGEAWREQLAQIEEAGATEIAFQPAGPDIPGELEALAEAARG